MSVLLVACGGDGTKSVTPPTTTDSSDITVQLSTATVDPPSLDATSDTFPVVRCRVQFVASVTGTGKGTWIDGAFRFYDLRDTTRQLGSIDIQGETVLGAWGGGTIGGGRGQTSAWVFSTPTPFAAQFDMRYQVGTSSNFKTTTTSFRCTPPIAAGVAKPTISAVTVDPTSGSIKAGTPLRVDFSANAPAGALMTGVRITGPCIIERRFIESFQPTATHSVSIVLPYPCKLGVPIGVNVLVVDALSDADAQYTAMPVTQIDTAAPTLDPYFLQKNAWGQFGPVPGGDYTTKDSVRVMVYVHDNYKFKTFLWEVLPVGLKDSVVFADSTVGQDATDNYVPLDIPVTSSWVGKQIQFRLQGRDAQGNLSAVLLTPADSIRVTAAPAGP